MARHAPITPVEEVRLRSLQDAKGFLDSLTEAWFVNCSRRGGTCARPFGLKGRPQVAALQISVL